MAVEPESLACSLPGPERHVRQGADTNGRLLQHPEARLQGGGPWRGRGTGPRWRQREMRREMRNLMESWKEGREEGEKGRQQMEHARRRRGSKMRSKGEQGGKNERERWDKGLG